MSAGDEVTDVEAILTLVGGIGTAVLIALLVLFSHRGNIVRLLRHTENRLDFHKIHDISVKHYIAKKKRDRK